jgi:hypothetical protein
MDTMDTVDTVDTVDTEGCIVGAEAQGVVMVVTSRASSLLTVLRPLGPRLGLFAPQGARASNPGGLLDAGILGSARGRAGGSPNSHTCVPECIVSPCHSDVKHKIQKNVL